MNTPSTLRNASLQDLAETLQEQADSRFDVVASSSNLSFREGNLIVQGADAIITDEGVTSVETHLRPTSIFDEGVSQRLDIPRKYLRRMRDEGHAGLLDHNVNTWLHANERQWLVRGFKAEGDTEGIARAFLSDKYRVIDNLDVLLSVLSGVKEAGVGAEVEKCDLTERRMRVRIKSPEIMAEAPTLLENYRSPFQGTGHGGETAENPHAVFAGFDISNSETGGGAFTITPVLIVKVCDNGAVLTELAQRNVHLGAAMNEGVIKWSAETQQANVDLVRAQTVDAVSTFLDVDFLRTQIGRIEEKSGVEVAEPTKVMEKVAKHLSFTEKESEGILGHFIKGGDLTSGGVMQAVTSWAQEIEDPDRAIEVEAQGIPALNFTAGLVTS